MSQSIDYTVLNSDDLILRSQKGDQNALKLLTQTHTPLVKAMVKRFNSCVQDKEDLMQIGYIGLIKAIKGFDPSYNVQFSTYAVPLIIGEIKRYIRDEGAVKVSRSVKELRQRIKNFCQQYLAEFGKEPTIDCICIGVKCSQEQVLEAIESGFAPISLEQTYCMDDGNNDCLLNHIQSKKEIDWLDIIQLKDCVNDLTSQEKNLLSMRYYLNLTQSVIADKLGMSQVQVSRLESKIIKKLRCKMK